MCFLITCDIPCDITPPMLPYHMVYHTSLNRYHNRYQEGGIYQPVWYIPCDITPPNLPAEPAGLGSGYHACKAKCLATMPHSSSTELLCRAASSEATRPKRRCRIFHFRAAKCTATISSLGSLICGSLYNGDPLRAESMASLTN